MGVAQLSVKEVAMLEFNNSMFIGINGFLGAALMIFASNITFRGSIVFADNSGTLRHGSTISRISAVSAHEYHLHLYH